MPELRKVQLLNSRGRVTTHVFSHITSDKRAMYPMFRCEETGVARVYGYLRASLTHGELEDEFGPLDVQLRALPARDKAA